MAVATKGEGSIGELAQAVRTLESQVREADWAVEEAALHERNLAPFGNEGIEPRVRLVEAINRRDTLRKELEAARSSWLEAARPKLIAARDQALVDARSFADARAAAAGALFDALDGLLEANASWAIDEQAVREALDRLAAASDSLGEAMPPGAPLRAEHPLVFLRPPDLPQLGLLFGSVGMHQPSKEAFGAARAALARARKVHEQ